MAKIKNSGSLELKGILKRVKTSDLTANDRRVLSEILGHTIKLKQLVEKSKLSKGDKKVVTSLPFGFDIVK